MAVNFKITPTIQTSISVALSSSIPESLKLKLQPYSSSSLPSSSSSPSNNTSSIISFSILKELSSSLQQVDVPKGTRIYFHEMIIGSCVVLPSLVAVEPSAEAQAKKKILQSRYMHQQYNAMTKNVSNIQREKEELRRKDEMSTMKSHVGMALNLVFSMFTVFMIGWYVGRKIFSSDLVGVVIGLLGAIIIVVVEVTLIVIRLSRVDSGLDDIAKSDATKNINKNIEASIKPALVQPTKKGIEDEDSKLPSSEMIIDGEESKPIVDKVKRRTKKK